MRVLTLTFASLALLTACSGTTPSTPSTVAQQSPAPGQPAAPATGTVALNSASKLTMDGKAITAINATPVVTLVGGGTVSVINASQKTDRGYAVNLVFKSIKSGNKGLTADFKAEDIDRLEIRVEQFIADRYAGNTWTGTFDVPSANANTTLKRDGDRLSGTIHTTLQPDGKNETDAKKQMSIRYEFENAIKK